MLKKFFLNTLSSFAGTWLALALFSAVAVIVFLCVIGKLAIGAMESVGTPGVERHSVLRIELSGEIEETETSKNFDFYSVARGDMQKPSSLSTILNAIREGAANKNIDVLYLDCGGLVAGPATAHAIREAVVQFKKDAPDKKVIAYGDTYSQGDYYIASAADSILLNPMGQVALTGVGGSTMFLKGVFDKIGVQFQVAKVGKFKSAVEPYISTEMSEPARNQLDTLYSGIWQVMGNGFAAARSLSFPKLNNMVSNDYLLFADSKKAKALKLVDRICYHHQLEATFMKICDKDKAEDINYVSAETMASASSALGVANSKNQIAVLYACGEIQEGAKGGINCYDLVPIIQELQENDKVKGLVLRVNSPGGSVFGSEMIWHALEEFKKAGKTFTVSMGDYAASGGYYISCGADRIFADSLTITGSIGIFGLFPNGQGLMEKIGVATETVATNPNARIGLPFAPLTEGQMAAAQTMVEQGYDLFTSRVAQGRDISQDQVKEIGQGRVWGAVKAKEIGLVDELGSLMAAVEWTAKQTNLEDKYNMVLYPKYEQGFWDVVALQGMEALAPVSKVLGDNVPLQTAAKVKSVLSQKPVQARMPEFKVNL